MKTQEREKGPSLKEIIEREMAMVKKNRWLNDREKQLKIKQLEKVLNPEK